MKKRGLWAFLLSLFMLLSACEAQPERPTEQNSYFPLVNTDWQLTQFYQGSAKPSGKATLKLSKGRISGSAGCNRYFGNYTQRGEHLYFGQMGATKMLCLDMAEEDHFFKFMKRITRFEIHDNQLLLFKDTQPLMAFTATSQPILKSAITKTAIHGSVTYQQQKLLLGDYRLQVVLEDVSRQDVEAEIIAEYNKPIKSQVPLKFSLAYDPKQLKVGHRYNLRARIIDSKSEKAEWITTKAYPFIPDTTANIELLVRPVAQAQITASQNLEFQCGNNTVSVLLIGDNAIKLEMDNGKWILSRVRSASGSKYQNGQLMFWIKGEEAILEQDKRHQRCRLKGN